MNRSAITRHVHISADDASLSPVAGLLLPGELVRRTGLIAAIDDAVNAVDPFKKRDRGASAGELLVALAESMLGGGDHVAHLDVIRQDDAGAGLRAVADTPAPSTACQLLKRLTVDQCRGAVAALAKAGNRIDADLGLDATAPITLDLDATTTEVYGRKKQGAAFNYEGRRSYSSQLVTWAERFRILAIELFSGNASAKPTSPELLREALNTLPADHGQVSLRGDSDYYYMDLLHECRRQQVKFAVSVPRNEAMWRANTKIDPSAWQPAIDMPGAEIAETTYTPTDWKHEPLRLIIRRTLINADDISASPRARRRRTIPKSQLSLALSGVANHVYGYSFIITDRPGDITAVELWQRQRAHIEERIKDAKHGCGLFHLPLGTMRANRGWQTASALAVNLTAMLSAVLVSTMPSPPVETFASADESVEAEPDQEPTHRLAKTMRRWMFAVPGRLAYTARRVHLHLPKGWLWADQIIAVYERLRLIPAT